MGKWLLISLLTITPIYQTSICEAQDATVKPWTLEADLITYHNSPRKITAEGKVVLHHKGEESGAPLKIQADSVTYQATNSELDATGNVSLKEELGTISASSIRLNLQDRTGQLTSSTISMSDHKIKFSGKLAEKIDEDRYVFYDGRATSCQTEGNESPDWSINWRKADITIDGMAFLKHATFKVKKVPLLYIPYMAIPVKTTRQTGFLFPEISHSSRDGIGGITPFFINLSPSSDLTLYPGYYEKRGSFGGMEFRHVIDYNSRATLAANYQADRTEDQEPPGSDNDYRRDGYLRTEHDRYWIRGKADLHFSRYSALRFDIDTVSDHDFLHEYREGITGFSASNRHFLDDFNRGLQEASLSFRESILQFSNRGKLSSSGVEVRYTDDTLADFTGTEPAQTLPRVVFSSRLPLNSLPLNFSWDSEYVNYRPEEGIGYQRLDLLPRLIMPMPFGSMFEGTIIGGFRETVYRVETIGTPVNKWQSSNTQNRNIWDLSANIAAVLARDFHVGVERLFTHTFRPNLRYDYMEVGDQSDLPNMDNLDRFIDGNTITLELNNYFRSSKVEAKKGLQSRQLGFLKLNQSYDIEEARRNLTSPDDKRRPFSDIAMDLEVSPMTNLFLRYQTALNVYGQGVNRYKLQGRYSNARRDNLKIDYDYKKGTTRNLNISSQLKLTGNLSARYSTTRSLLDNHATAESIGLLYNSQCWGIELTSTKDSEDKRIMLTFSLTGIGKALEVGKSEI